MDTWYTIPNYTKYTGLVLHKPPKTQLRDCVQTLLVSCGVTARRDPWLYSARDGSPGTTRGFCLIFSRELDVSLSYRDSLSLLDLVVGLIIDLLIVIGQIGVLGFFLEIGIDFHTMVAHTTPPLDQRHGAGQRPQSRVASARRDH